MGRLAKDCAKFQGLSNGRCGKVQILLLDITRFTLERLVTLATVHQHLTSHDTRGNASGKDVKERRLASTRDTLKNIVSDPIAE